MASNNNPIDENKKFSFNFDFSAVRRWIEQARKVFNRTATPASQEIKYAGGYDKERQELIINSVTVSERLATETEKYNNLRDRNNPGFIQRFRIERLERKIHSLIDKCDQLENSLMEIAPQYKRDALNIEIGKVMIHVGNMGRSARNILKGMDVERSNRDLQATAKDMQAYKNMPQFLLGSLIKLIDSCVSRLLKNHSQSEQRDTKKEAIKGEGQIEGLNMLASYLEEIKEYGPHLTDNNEMKELFANTPSYKAPSIELLQNKSQIKETYVEEDKQQLEIIKSNMEALGVRQENSTVSPLHTEAASVNHVKEGRVSR